MLADCEAGKIDIILTKSISRFARNTVDLLETVRHLKDLGVEVQFEKERIRAMDGDGELMLTILASFAQEAVSYTHLDVYKRQQHGHAAHRKHGVQPHLPHRGRDHLRGCRRRENRMAQKKIPARQCIGCLTSRPKKELVRVVRAPSGEISIDQIGRAHV